MTTSRARALTHRGLSAAVLSTSLLALVAPTGSADATTARPPKVIAYAGGESPGAFVHGSADTDVLHGTGAGLRRYIGRLADRVVAASTCDDTSEVGVVVDVVRTDGYAAGAVATCGGYQAMWARMHGSWRQIQATQDTWDCRPLHRYHVPSDVAGDSCFAYHGDHREHPHHQD